MEKTNINNDKILEVKDLRISFRTDSGTVKAVRGISFDLYRGKTLAIVGESGSGKSVTSKAILGILANNKIIENGQIIYDGKDLLQISEEDFSKLRGVKISMIFQDPLSSLNPIMIVGKQLTEAMVLKHKATVKEGKRFVKKIDKYLGNADKTLLTSLKEDMKAGTPDLQKYSDLFSNAVQSALIAQEEAIKAVVPELEILYGDKCSGSDINFLEIAAELKHLYKNIAKCEYPLSRSRDNVISVFPLIIKNIFLSLKDNAKQEKILQDALKKNNVSSFYDLPAATRAKMREVIISKEEEANRLKKAIFDLTVHLKELTKNDEEKLSLLVATLKKDYLAAYNDSISKLTRDMAKERAIKMLGEVGINEPEKRFNQYPFELSGGMRQRIVIAIALSSSPEILICDEPTTALDVTIQSQILELINKLKAEKNLSIVFITHDLGVVANMADDIAVMYAGKIVEQGTATDIFYDPRHPYTWALLGSVPDLNTKEKLNAIPGTPPNMLLPPKGDAFALRNANALEIDSLEEPPFFEVSPTHIAASWTLHEAAEEINPPAVVVERIAKAITAHPEYRPEPTNKKNSVLNHIDGKEGK